MATLSAVQTLTGTLSATGGMTGRLTVPRIISPDSYDGDYEVTPGETEQVLLTKDLMMLGNVTIGAIPANYGRVDYNGGYLRIS